MVGRFMKLVRNMLILLKEKEEKNKTKPRQQVLTWKIINGMEIVCAAKRLLLNKVRPVGDEWEVGSGQKGKEEEVPTKCN